MPRDRERAGGTTPDEPFPQRVGAARRPTRADLLAVVRACYGGWRTSVLRGRYGRLQAAILLLLLAGTGLASYAVARAGLTAPSGWHELSLAAWIVGTVVWLGLVVLQPAVTALLVLRGTSSAASYVLDGAPGEPAVLSAIRLRRVPKGLLIENHVAAQPGRGSGRRLRAEVGPHLSAVCDARGWTLHVIAVSRGMAEVYCAEFDGMVRGARTRFQRMTGTYPLERRPQPTRVGPAAGRSPD